ncbi:glycoside hydrolase family 3 C-terminal domain-containing protein [Liquorilactobacillus nagelii]|nr:glycoside hydrolase family 3 C-terminal domain-containing protein [Liquorilactobacillus nagelii]KRL41810.1 glucan 1,4-beta-glucosidase [Liquorilactobacillus nagelii DSM 13675]QYH55286.1 glycosyl hydrolase [Liquorilactobacillus nagelii DSM 13675]
MDSKKITEIIDKMSVEEKASFCSGENFWFLKKNEKFGIPQVMVSDGPHGLRKQESKADHLGIEKSVAAVCFPAGCLSAASFDPEITEMLGDSLGQECQHFDVATILGPSVNIKRSPLGGRNFEYYSEDPLVASKMATGFIKGVQRHHVGTSIKHFLANNQETRRMTSSSNIDERTLRELYLSAFEGAIKKAKPWTVMSSYNRVNGEYVGDSKHFLTDILRKEWGFDGMVMSDWGGVNDRVKSLKAGLDLEMPGTGEETTQQIIAAVENGSLSNKELDQAVKRILTFIFKYVDQHNSKDPLDLEHDHRVAQTVAEESIILLKNADQVLPLNSTQKVALIGEYAVTPRYQGGGSSHINSFKVVSAVAAAEKMGLDFDYAAGFNDQDQSEGEKLLQQAVAVAKKSQVAVVFAGLPDSFESEGYDRTKMQLPEYQNKLITAVAEVQPNTIVILHNGSPVEMPWINEVKGVIETYLGGQAVGQAVVNILTGKVNPSGKLAETFPVHLEDNPSYLFYGGQGDQVDYREGVFVGYRYYTSKKQPVLFPFGHGLSYTSFAYSNLILDQEQIDDTDRLTVNVDITNTGKVAGKEVVELYVASEKGKIIRPVIELKAFQKILLQPGETQTVSFELDKKAFAYWETKLHDWHVETGKYTIKIGSSVNDIRLEKQVKVLTTTRIPVEYNLNSTMGDILADPVAGPKLQAMMQQSAPTDVKQDDPDAAVSQEMMVAMVQSMPLRQLLSFVPGVTLTQLNQMLTVLNQK